MGESVEVAVQLVELHRTRVARSGIRRLSASTARRSYTGRVGPTRSGKPGSGDGRQPRTSAGMRRPASLPEKNLDPGAPAGSLILTAIRTLTPAHRHRSPHDMNRNRESRIVAVV